MNKVTSRNLFLICATVWIVAVAVWPGRFPHTDDAYFKEPAYQLVTSGRLVSPAYGGYFSLEPSLSETFAAYQPLYVYLAAGWFRVFPFSMASAAVFDAIIHLMLVTVLCRFFLVFLGDRFSRHLYLFAVALLLLGHPARPDEMSMCLAYGGVLWVFRNDRQDVAFPGMLAGVLFGLCAATSFPVTLTAGMWAGALWMQRLCDRGRRVIMLRRTVVTVFVALVVSLVILLPYYCRDGAWAQYRCLAEGSFCSGITRSVETRSFTPYLGMLRSCWRSNLSHSPLYATVFVLSVYLLFRGRPCGNNRLTRYMLGGALFSWFYIVVAQPDQYLYYWFAFPLLLAVLVERWGDSLVLRAALCLLVLVAANSASRDILKSAILPREQKLGSAVERILAEVPCDARILISDRLYFGLRKHYPDLRSAFAGDAGNLTWADYCVFCSHRLVESDGVYVPQTMLKESVVAVLSQDFELLDRNLPAAKPRFAGLPIGSRPVGYGAVIYRRKETHYE